MLSPGYYPCDYLGREVELTAAQIEHIRVAHLEFVNAPDQVLAHVLASPEEIRSKRPNARELLFIRWYPEVLGGKFAVVVVVADVPPGRPFVVTAYFARKIAGVRIWPAS